MTLDDQHAYLVLSHRFGPLLANRLDAEPIAPISCEQVEFDSLLEELADIIESEGGILIA